jgi:hypothetical protein
MKFSFTNIFFTLAAVFMMNVTAAEDAKKSPLTGLWVWTFTTSDGGQVTPRVRFKMKDGELTGTSTFRSGWDAPLKNIVFKDGQVGFDVARDYLGDKVTTHYSGKLSGTTITGKITAAANGETETYDWDAKRISGVEGVWKWTVTYNERSFDQRVTLKPEGEKLTGKLATGRGDIDIHHGRFKDNHIHFETERRGFDGEKTTNVYRGTLDGDKITGTYTSNFGGRRTNEWNAVRD